jgi:uncharacterized protein (DUF1501 family)
LPKSARAETLESASETTIFLCLRGGADALSLLVPYRCSAYYRARPRLAVAPPGTGPFAALTLDARFGLHPSLATLHEAFTRGELGVVAGVGFREPIRSHRAAEQALDAAIVASLGGKAPERRKGDLREGLVRLARQIREGAAPDAAVVESSGWDTHVAQGDARNGRLAGLARELDQTLAAFRSAVGDAISRARVIILTEFGRSLAETDLAGTEDGEASVLFVLGGASRLLSVRGDFAALEAQEYRDGQGLPATLDIANELSVLARGGWSR